MSRRQLTSLIYLLVLVLAGHAMAEMKGHLYVYTEPQGARVRILNIKPKFYQRMVLKPGPYQVEVSAKGYETKKMWVTVNPGKDERIRIHLKQTRRTKKVRTSDELFKKGLSFFNLGEYKKAIPFFKKALDKEPNNDKILFDLGVSYSKLGLHRDAIEAYKQAIRIKPHYADDHFNMGVSYRKLGLYRDAIEAFKQAIRIKTDYAEAHLNMGLSYGMLDLYRDAIEAFKQAIRIKPDYTDAHFFMGLSYLNIGNKGAALDEYKILKDLDKSLANELFDSIYK